MPQLTQISLSASAGGKVQIVKYELAQDYHASLSETWNVEDMSPEEVETFRAERAVELRKKVDELGQKEFDALWDLREGK